MQSAKILFPSQCKNRTDLHGSTNYLVACSAVLGKLIESFKISGLPIDMVPCLHQCNVDIERKLWVWIGHKYNFLVGAKTGPTVTGQQTTPCLAEPYWDNQQKFLKFRGYLSPWYRVCTNAESILKGSYGCEEAYKYHFLVGAKSAPTFTGQQTYPVPCNTVFAQSMRKFKNFWAILFAMVPYLYLMQSLH